MTALWISLLFLLPVWLMTTGFTDHYQGGSLIYLVFALIFAAFALRRKKVSHINPLFYLFTLPLLGLTFVLPFPYNFSFALLLIGLAFLPLRIYWSFFSSLFLAFWTVGLIALAQTVLTAFYPLFASRAHGQNWSTPLFHILARALHINTAFSQNTLFVEVPGQVIGFTTNLEKLGIYPLALFVSGGIVLLILVGSSRRWLSIMKFLGICAIYVIFRYIFLILFFAEIRDIYLFRGAKPLSVSFLPLGLLSILLFPLTRGQEEDAISFEFGLRRADLWTMALFFIGAFSFGSFYVYHAPGKQKEGRILVDEKYSRWEWSEVELNTTTYGTKTVYNYYCLVEHLKYFYQRVDRNFKPITPELLAGYDVLILKTPTKKYEEGEVHAIVNFVKHGGGLWLIGDHTNVFGMNTYLNMISETFGICFMTDALTDLDRSRRQVYYRPEFLPHPIVRNMPPILFATSCSIKAKVSAEDVIVGKRLLSDHPDYSVNTFFGDFTLSTDEDFGVFLQCVAVKSGKGRVVAFSDSTVFSNFTMFMPGKPELALATIDWLNSTNEYVWIRRLAAVIALGAFGSALLLSRKSKGLQKAFTLFLSSSLGILMALAVFDCLSGRNHQLPAPHTEYTNICFEQEHSRYDLPILHDPPEEDPNGYQTFYVWTQRLGFVPSAKSLLEESLSGDCLVIINPQSPFSNDEKERLLEYIESGGKVLLMDNHRNTGSSANQLLNAFGMRIHYSRIESGELFRHEDGIDESVIAIRDFCSVIGGNSVLTANDGTSVLSMQQIGSGLLAVFSASNYFSDKKMGSTSVRPNEEQLKISQLEFWIFSSLLGLGRKSSI